MKKCYQHAITRTPPLRMADGITTQSDKVDLSRALQQHKNYIAALESLGISVTVLSANNDFPDSHFIEDGAILHQGAAVLTRPGAEERRGEVALLRPSLENQFEIFEISEEDNSLLDGGDVLFIENQVLIGLSHRTNEAGATNLKNILQRVDPTLSFHFIPFEGVLHLKSGITALTPTLLLASPHINYHVPLPINNIITLPPEEAHAANIVVANGAAFTFPNCPTVHQAITNAGLTPIEIDISEFRKMDGSFTCLSLIW